MSSPLRVEFTILDKKLFREDVQWSDSPVPHLRYCTHYKDAVSSPFPEDGKSGLSILVGKVEQFKEVEVPLLWALEKKRGRTCLAVVTNLRGKDFIPALTEIGSSLSDLTLAPLSFLRRRKDKWDSLDFFSSGSSDSMLGAAYRLRRLKQRGWEELVDRLCLINPQIKDTYFSTLDVERESLKMALLDGLGSGNMTAMVGIAGQCLQREHLALLLSESMNSTILSRVSESQVQPGAPGEWTYLSKRNGGKELVLISEGENWLQPDEVLQGQVRAPEGKSELAVAKVLQRTQKECCGTVFTVARLEVKWRYLPEREIPTVWLQKTATTAGSPASDG